MDGLASGVGLVVLERRGTGRVWVGGCQMVRFGFGATVRITGARPSCPVPGGTGVTADAGGIGSAWASPQPTRTEAANASP